MIQLYAHQSEGARRCSGRSRYGLWMDCGTGKTHTMLSVCAARPMRTLVVAPKSVLDDAWMKDGAAYPSLRFEIGRGGKKLDRIARIKSTAWNMLLVNYETMRTHLEVLLSTGIQRVIFDEASALKNYKSSQSKSAIALAEHMREVYLLSGTPAPNGEWEYIPLMIALKAPGFTSNYYRELNRWFFPIKNHMGHATSFVLRENRREQFQQSLSACSWSLRKQDCLDLPTQTDITRTCELSPEERFAYTEMQTALAVWVKSQGQNILIDAHANAQLIKLRQLAGGMVYDNLGGMHQTGTSKLDLLQEVLDEIGDRPIVIWSEFTGDVHRIGDVLGDRCRKVHGKTPDPARKAAFAGLGKDFQYLVAHPRTCGHGVTLTAANYMVHYTEGYSYELYQQKRDRIHRIGQRWPCTYYHLLARDTCDIAVLKAVQAKQRVSEVMRAILATCWVGVGSVTLANDVAMKTD